MVSCHSLALETHYRPLHLGFVRRFQRKNTKSQKHIFSASWNPPDNVGFICWGLKKSISDIPPLWRWMTFCLFCSQHLKKKKKRKERKATFEKLNTSRFSEKMLSGKSYHWKYFRPEKQIDTFFCSFSDLEILKKTTQHIKPKLSAFMFQIWRDFSFPQEKIIMIDNSINLLPTSPVRFSKKNMAAVFENCQCKICVGKCTYSISCWKLNEKVNTAPIDVRWMWS